MLIKFPKDDKGFLWTTHIKNKMVFYGLSEQKIRAVLSNPARKEEGVAEKTVAVMKRNDRGKKREELWVMYQVRGTRKSAGGEALYGRQEIVNRNKKTMISAWRYPGVSKPGAKIPIPEDILNELDEIIYKG